MNISDTGTAYAILSSISGMTQDDVWLVGKVGIETWIYPGVPCGIVQLKVIQHGIGRFCVFAWNCNLEVAVSLRHLDDLVCVGLVQVAIVKADIRQTITGFDRELDLEGIAGVDVWWWLMMAAGTGL